MESREEIESMRVVDLRDFLRRHGHPLKTVVRANGTPGPMRKAELLEAALEIYGEYDKGKPSPIKSSELKQKPNPFQSGLPTPPEKRKATQPQPSADEGHGIQESPASKPSKPATPKTRRPSSAWIDPELLAQMRATTPQKTLDTPSYNLPSAPRPSLSTPKRSTPRRAPPASPYRPPQRVIRQIPAEDPPSRPPQRLPARVITTPKQSRPTRPMTPRRLAVRKPDPELVFATEDKVSRATTSVSQPVADVPPPPAPSRKVQNVPSSDAPTKREFAFHIDVDDLDYVSGDDSDYDADGEDADSDDFDAGYNDGVVDFVAEGLTKHFVAEDLTKRSLRSAPRYSEVKFDVAPSPSFPAQEEKNVKTYGQEDILIDSDHYRSDEAGESDPGSTVDTEDEDHAQNFADWSTWDIKEWLRAHNVRFRQGASRDVLISVARAHALHMEATASVREQRPTMRRPLEEEEDEIIPNPRATDSTRRRRIISAPLPDDDIEIEPAQSGAVSRFGSRPAEKKTQDYREKTFAGESQRKRLPFVLFPLIALLVFLCSSGFIALSILQKHLTMKYCDTGAAISGLENGKECRPCPRNGRCYNGKLVCEPGFVELRGRCLEDKEFILFSERLAYSSFEYMSDLAGRSECGEDVISVISPEELATAMLTKYSGKSRMRRQTLDEQWFEDAIMKAIRTLRTDDAFDVGVTESGYLFSNKPRLSIKCRLWRKLYEYMHVLLGTVVVAIFIVYFRVKQYFKKLHERRVDEAHASALEYLREQVNGFRSNEEDVAFVPDVMLREEVVGRPTTENKKFWKEVEERLNRDARVIRKHQVLKGMPSYTFEYVGSRRMSGSRMSGTFLDSFSRRGSFGSRTSLDNLDLGSERSVDEGGQRGLWGFIGRLVSHRTE